MLSSRTQVIGHAFQHVLSPIKPGRGWNTYIIGLANSDKLACRVEPDGAISPDQFRDFAFLFEGVISEYKRKFDTLVSTDERLNEDFYLNRGFVGQILNLMNSMVVLDGVFALDREDFEF